MKPDLNRCNWGSISKEYKKYHDTEWGVPVYDDQVFFEFLILEGAQAGLSWSTILKRREGYRKAFADFNPNVVALFSKENEEELLHNPGIIRNKLKIKSAIQNAKHFLEIQNEYGSFSSYVWQFVNGEPIQNHWQSIQDVPATSKESDALSKDLKKRGFTFCGSTIMYAFMQASGLVNDHEVACFRYAEVKDI